MNDNLFQTQYDVTKKDKIKKFYEKNRIVIFSSIVILLIFIVSLSFYLEDKKKKRILLSENYIQAKIYSKNGKNKEAMEILKEIVLKNDSTYSTLSLFLILDENLLKNKKELSSLFDHVLDNNKFDNDVKNLIIFKKVLFESSYINESDLIASIKPLLKEENLWKPHALLLLGDYFVSKNEYIKAREFYNKVFSIKNLRKEFYERANSQLILIKNE
tara:strand:+ start:2969 stop:3616 length:648 start_codon:yes stop_codon:yes gene_type:complete